MDPNIKSYKDLYNFSVEKVRIIINKQISSLVQLIYHASVHQINEWVCCNRIAGNLLENFSTTIGLETRIFQDS